MKKRRFNNELGEEYDLFSIALPHQDIIQKESVQILKNNLKETVLPKVLEIGFGTGITTMEILNCIPKIQLTSLDNEPAMYDRAKDKLKNITSDFSFLKIEDGLTFLKSQPSNSFDGIISVWVIHNLLKEDQTEIIIEIFRVLRDGGIFVNGDKIVPSDSQQYKTDFDWQIKMFDKFTGIGRDDLRISWKKHYEEDGCDDRLINEAGYYDLLVKTGFKKVSFSNRNHLDIIAIALK